MNHLLALIVGLVILVFGLGFAQRAAAERAIAEARAESMIIRAQSQARLDSAQASAITLAATLPHVMILTGGCVGGLFAIALITFAWNYRPERKEVKIIERQVIYALPPGTPRRELWRLMSGDSHPLIVEGEVKRQ